MNNDKRPKDYHFAVMHREAVYPIMCKWWEAHGWDIIPKEVLPPNAAVGFIGDRIICCVYAYEPAGTPVAWVDYMVTNPDAGLKGGLCLKYVIEDFCKMLAKSGKTVFQSCCRQASLGRLLEKAGFTKTDEGVSHFLMFSNQ